MSALATTLHPPIAPATGVLVVCVPGGGYSSAVLDLELEGEARLSLVAELTGAGHAVLTVDVPESGDEWTLDRTASRIGAAVDDARRQTGALHTIGLGHSLGGALVVAAHAIARCFSGVAVLGYSPAWESVPAALPHLDDDDVRALAMETLRANDPELWSGEQVLFPREPGSRFSYAPDVPAAVRSAIDADHHPIARALAADFGIPRFSQRHAHRLDCPVLLVFGGTDASPDPRSEAAFYPASPAIDLELLPRSAHVHVASSDRVALWAAIDAWMSRTVRTSGEDDS